MAISTKESRKLLRQLYKNTTTHNQRKLSIRNLTMALLMLDLGLRISEVVQLTVSDLFIQDKPREILHVVRGLQKKSHDRFIPLAGRVHCLIESMNEFWWIPDADKPGNFAFYNYSPLSHITKRQFQRIVKHVSIEAFGYSISPNILRKI